MKTIRSRFRLRVLAVLGALALVGTLLKFHQDPKIITAASYANSSTHGQQSMAEHGSNAQRQRVAEEVAQLLVNESSSLRARLEAIKSQSTADLKSLVERHQSLERSYNTHLGAYKQILRERNTFVAQHEPVPPDVDEKVSFLEQKLIQENRDLSKSASEIQSRFKRQVYEKHSLSVEGEQG